MLSELYGRIGQQLREHGDAEIVRLPLPQEGVLPRNIFTATDVSFTFEYDVNGNGKQYVLNFK